MDIREILEALDSSDKKLWAECRTAMRKVYLTAHNKVLGLQNYEAQDDDFMDLIDIRLALIFDRAGRVVTTTPIKGADVEKIESGLANNDRELKMKIAAGVLPVNEWK